MLDTFERLAHFPIRLAGYRSMFVPTTVGKIHILSVDGKGAGPALVMLHGFTAAAIHYVPLIQRMRGHLSQIFAVDLPAHGRSDSPLHGADTQILKLALTEALDTLLPEPAVLFGNSLGGFTALLYALQRPDRLRGLILCSPAGAMMEKDELATFTRDFHITTTAKALAFTDKLLHKGSIMRRPLAWGIRRKFSDPAMLNLIDSLEHDDLLTPEQLQSLRLPTRMIWGKRDLILPTSQREYFRRWLPKSVEWSEPDDYSHSPYLDHLPEVADEIVDFVKRH